MGIIAKGDITLSPVNDAYTVAITPSSCVIKADFDGSNPQLSSSLCTITVKRGSIPVVAHIESFEYSSSVSTVSIIEPRGESISFILTAIDKTTLEGWVDVNIAIDDGFEYYTKVRMTYSVVRESTMLDWIQDWEGSKTKVGGTYIMTPKLFVGHKESVVHSIQEENSESITEYYEWIEDALTGVYIGPDLLGEGQTVGLYGYYLSQEIFHLNSVGGMIGGWSFNQVGLLSGNGVVNILAEGSIFAKDPESTTPYWGIFADGYATFAKGNVKFKADGSAEFAGKVSSTSGEIGGWAISQHQIYSSGIILDSNKGYIGINASLFLSVDANTGDAIFPDFPSDAIKLWHTSTADFGFAGWTNNHKVFQLGSYNMIAGWKFTHQALFTGSTTPNIVQGSYTVQDSITLAPSGIRSYKWYIDADGTAAFVGGGVKFEKDKAEMFGWLLRSGRFSSKHAAVISNSSNCGFYVSPEDISETSYSSLRSIISNDGGIYMYSDEANSVMCAYDQSGKLGFRLSTTGIHQIGNWNFDCQSIYTGSTLLDDHGFTQSVNSMILSTSGLIGNMWKLLIDGSGALAGGNIAWDAEGNVSFGESVKISWEQLINVEGVMTKATYIDANGIFTGNIDANKITTGTLSASRINSDELLSNGNKWALNQTGAGYLASKNIEWDQDGNLNVKGLFSQVLKDIEFSDAVSLSTVGSINDIPIVSKYKLNKDLYIVFNNLTPNSENEQEIFTRITHYTSTIILPISEFYVGKEIKIYHMNYGPFTKSDESYWDIFIEPELGTILGIPPIYSNVLSPTTENGWDSIRLLGGYIEFVGVPFKYWDEQNSNLKIRTRWVCTNFNGLIVDGIHNHTSYNLAYNFEINA